MFIRTFRNRCFEWFQFAIKTSALWLCFECTSILGHSLRFGPAHPNGHVWESTSANDLQIVNYQRCIPTPTDPDPDILKYKLRKLLLNHRKETKINMFPCLIFAGVEWYITYGFAEKFLCLIEPFDGSFLIVTALIEFSAELSESETPEELYRNFQEQVTTNLGNNHCINFVQYCCRRD